MQAMEEHITVAEQKQQHTTVFLARAMKKPGFLKMLVGRARGASTQGERGRAAASGAAPQAEEEPEDRGERSGGGE